MPHSLTIPLIHGVLCFPFFDTAKRMLTVPIHGPLRSHLTKRCAQYAVISVFTGSLNGYCFAKHKSEV